ANVVLKSGAPGRIPLEEMRWARHTLPDQRLGAGVYRAQEVVSPGDIVLVEPLGGAAPEAAPNGRRGGSPTLLYGLRQVPDVSGGFLAMDPKTGRAFAIVGGWDFRESQFDRATQAKRQPGSSIKPFVYVTALQGDYTPSSIIEDAPISLPQGPGMPDWTPANYEGNYVGATTLRQALVHSRNLATARLASQIGLPAIKKTVEQFGIMNKMPLYYSMALGAGDTTLFRMVSAYSMFDNGGHWLNASLIDMVQDKDGRILYQKGTADCAACFITAGPQLAPDRDPAYTVAGHANPAQIWLKSASFADHPLLYKPTKPDPLVDPIANEQIISMMEGVVQHGTGIKVADVGKPLAGKTGTSSDWFDAWFVGFSPDLAAGAYVGFDTPRTLGDGETGGNVAAPIFRDFMAAALKDQPGIPFPQNVPGAEMVLVNAISGQPTVAGDKDAVLEAFRSGSGPAGSARSYGNSQQIAAASTHYPSAQEAAEAIDGGMPMTPMNTSATMPSPRGSQMANMPMGPTPLDATGSMGTPGAIPTGSMGGSAMSQMPTLPVNARVPIGTVVPPPPRTLGTGTGGLY
ncbi:MAG TPA: penicillin-binding transpeptidase domain-containing protein, partial [Stellaceae bacterium]|nr:penicillin-binding transpeptidase domain-containing protein [Stellaceae bacterium]